MKDGYKEAQRIRQEWDDFEQELNDMYHYMGIHVCHGTLLRSTNWNEFYRLLVLKRNALWTN
jgi:hypothetical protein